MHIVVASIVWAAVGVSLGYLVVWLIAVAAGPCYSSAGQPPQGDPGQAENLS